jgi:hypothetical protein
MTQILSLFFNLFISEVGRAVTLLLDNVEKKSMLFDYGGLFEITDKNLRAFHCFLI